MLVPSAHPVSIVWIAIVWVTLLPYSTAEMKALSDHELSNAVAQASIVTIPFSIDSYRQSIDLRTLRDANKQLIDRNIYLDEIEQNETIDLARLEQDIEAALITASAQIASTTVLTGLFPVIGIPIGVGISAAPDTFEVYVTDVNVNVDLTIELRE